jgi:signal transduction histidine kinase
MSLKFLSQIRKTLSFRLTVWYSGLFTLSVLALFAVAYVLLSSSLHRRDREAIRSELAEYAGAYRTGGMEAIKERIAAGGSQVGALPFFVRVEGAHHKTLFLHPTREWEKFDVALLTTRAGKGAEPWITVPAKDDDEEDLEMASARLPDGALLQVGLHTEHREELLEQFRDTFVAVMIPVVVMGLAGGTFLALRALRPLRGFLHTLQSIVATGTLASRAPVAYNGDELGELSVLFNDMLDRIGRLIAGMHDTLDNVAHDLRTPMTRLRGMAEMALQAEAPPDRLRDALANCLEESDRILAMLNTLMDISEAETGAMKLEVEVVNVRELIEQVVELYGDVAEEKGVMITTAVPQDLSLAADRNRMLEALANLLDNAIKYTPRGGRVEIAGSLRQQQVILTVTDTGMGIPSEDLPKIWDRLYRGDESRSQRGLGLGLSLVKAVVQAHQGSVEAASSSTHGSRFTVSLPV